MNKLLYEDFYYYYLSMQLTLLWALDNGGYLHQNLEQETTLNGPINISVFQAPRPSLTRNFSQVFLHRPFCNFLGLLFPSPLDPIMSRPASGPRLFWFPTLIHSGISVHNQKFSCCVSITTCLAFLILLTTLSSIL